jgi:cysteine synthase A
MDESEQDIARSTPNYRFDSPPPVAPAKDEDKEDEPLVVAKDAREFLRTATSDRDQPVVMFALEWCEFSWSVRKMFAHYGIPYRSVDLDSVAYQKDNRGGNIRAAIQEQTGLKTIPQIYIGGKHVGGATELFDAAKDGSMAALLKENNVSWTESENRDPYTFLPGWLHAR